ncbi:Uma2 family endonuclease [Limnoraphis robusta]|uniref:Uma2 family endonuclease n=1 Tax=Limnoraphis robusta CCNP1315 TaxID=3110306 RepID=A0ABU5U6R0_9CYAN|nr:Uma2 family endonuclease [Limnoraphis robusta]MEA5521803.1 Uma2 family endonuclease [Limnoraphis robusta CCNP1315]MEA5544001.1 Uma2 family endonuclease [Limnoraphis robusta CCNP1324]
MIQSKPQFLSFDEFIAWYPENSEHRYELHNGVIIEMPKPRGKHSEIAGFLSLELGLQCRNRQLPYLIPKECVVKPLREESGYEPDVIILDRLSVVNEPRWETGSIITMGSSIRLIVEVVSSNWRDDYALKASDYEEMGIAEYWIVDYLGLGGKRFIGNPKQPTISVYNLVEGEYQVNQFRGNNLIESVAFAELNLTAEKIFQGIR